MRRPWQYTLLGAAIAFFVLYGIELASDGVEDVYGPAEPRTERSVPGIAANAGDPYPSGGRVGAQAGARRAKHGPFARAPSSGRQTQDRRQTPRHTRPRRGLIDVLYRPDCAKSIGAAPACG